MQYGKKMGMVLLFAEENLNAEKHTMHTAAFAPRDCGLLQ